jgi:hypothetical protein
MTHMLDKGFATIIRRMNKLDRADRSQILHLLCEGSSIRAVTRLTCASKNTVIKLMIDAGKACAAYHHEHVRNLKTKRCQVDEIWSFTYAQQKNVRAAKAAPPNAGDTWTWTAIDADSKLMISWLVGGRDSDYAIAFMDDLRSPSPIASNSPAMATGLIWRRLKGGSVPMSTMLSL